MEREILIPMTHEQIGYVLELLNNECVAGNVNAMFAETLFTQLVTQEAIAGAAYAEEDAYWSAREADLNDEHVEAECTARGLGY